uniref:Uncharacterized protein n=1 Tax=Spironucleus salmonicida TaxID=348837 RepID=V6LPA2_9EUKA|eukprot:EST42554.1 Hypothetical protein SS50377_17869 [Spironucleus salmonicida]
MKTIIAHAFIFTLRSKFQKVEDRKQRIQLITESITDKNDTIRLNLAKVD